jgi:hypothetical protein
MTYKPPVAIYDACVLYPFHLRNLLIQCAADRLVDAHWTDDIHDEWIRNLVENSPSVSIERLHRTRDLMEKALPSASVTGHRQHLPNITLPDPDDRHVVAAGIEAGASIIVTWNVRDFPIKELSRHGLRKQKPGLPAGYLRDGPGCRHRGYGKGQEKPKQVWNLRLGFH